MHAVPGAGLHVPIWILGSSLFGAQLAAELGLPYAFASHFAPGQLTRAIEVYRQRFQPSEYLDRPRLMLGINVVAADTDREARRLFTSHQQAFLGLRRGRRSSSRRRSDPERFDAELSPLERVELQHTLSAAIVGAPDTVRDGLSAFIARTSPDELIVTGQIFDHAARLHSYEILADVSLRREGCQAGPNNAGLRRRWRRTTWRFISTTIWRGLSWRSSCSTTSSVRILVNLCSSCCSPARRYRAGPRRSAAAHVQAQRGGKPCAAGDGVAGRGRWR